MFLRDVVMRLASRGRGAARGQTGTRVRAGRAGLNGLWAPREDCSPFGGNNPRRWAVCGLLVSRLPHPLLGASYACSSTNEAAPTEVHPRSARSLLRSESDQCVPTLVKQSLTRRDCVYHGLAAKRGASGQLCR